MLAYPENPWLHAVSVALCAAKADAGTLGPVWLFGVPTHMSTALAVLAGAAVLAFCFVPPWWLVRRRNQAEERRYLARVPRYAVTCDCGSFTFDSEAIAHEWMRTHTCR